MQLKYLPTVLLAALPLTAARAGGHGIGNNAHGQGQARAQEGQNNNNRNNNRNNGVRNGNINDARGSNRGDRPFRITSYTIGETPQRKSYFTQPLIEDNPWMLYTTPSLSESEIFHVDGDNYLWYSSTSPELPGPVYSFFYTEKLQGEGRLRYVGFWYKDGVEYFADEMEFFRWCVDFEDKTIELVYPEGLILATCEVEVEGLGKVDEWFVGRPPFLEDNGCERIEIGIEEIV
ncbi:hypothetical protein V8F33_013073 [Rhypophila sp. PSN 637]